jgi:hypothetical protein
VGPIHDLLAAKAALASERPSIGTARCGQARYNQGQPHSLTALGTPHNRDSGIRRIGPDKDTYPSAADLIAEAPDVFAQLVASCQGQPATLDLKVFLNVVYLGAVCGVGTTLACPTIAIGNLVRMFLKHRRSPPPYRGKRVCSNYALDSQKMQSGWLKDLKRSNHAVAGARREA